MSPVGELTMTETDPEGRAKAAREALREHVPEAELHDAHPALPLVRARGDVPETRELEDLPLAWLARPREQRRRARERFRCALLTWTPEGRWPPRFEAKLPRRREREALLALGGVSALGGKWVGGTLAPDVAGVLAASRIGGLYTYERDRLLIVAEDWRSVGIWLTPLETAVLAPLLAEAARGTSPQPAGRERRRAWLLVRLRQHLPVLPVVGLAFAAGSLDGSDMLVLAPIVVLGVVAGELLIKRLAFARWYDPDE
jgi:hypothetical protein